MNSFGRAVGRGLAAGSLIALIAVLLSWPGESGQSCTVIPWIRENVLAWILAQFSPLMISGPVYGAFALVGTGTLWLWWRLGRLPSAFVFLSFGWFACIAGVAMTMAYGLEPMGVVIGTMVAFPLAAFVSRRAVGWRARAGSFTTAWGYAAPIVSVLVAMAIVAWWMLLPITADPLASRISDRFAYGIMARGNPVALFWTDKSALWTCDDVHGRPCEPRLVTSNVSERLWAGRDGFFGMGMSRFLKVTPDLAVEQREVPEQLRPIIALAEDPSTGSVVIIAEWGSRWAVMGTDDKVVASGQLDWKHGWPFPWITIDADRRRAFISEALHSGTLNILDLRTNRMTRWAPHLYLYETAYDAASGTLWGTRPILGQLVAVDIDTLAVVRTVDLGPALRPLRFSPSRRALYSCSFRTGDVYEVDADTGATTRLGRCGRLCRGLDLDESHDTLWVASLDGVCRYPIRDCPEGPCPR